MSERTNPLSARSFREDRTAWQVLFVVAIVVVAGGYWHLHRAVVPPPDFARASSADPRIVVLAYDRVSDRGAEAHLDPGIVRRQLESLRRDGFEPITLQELFAFYDRSRPLPPKSVLLTFDFGYIETYAAVDPILREMAWRAVMFLVTDRQERRNGAFVYWDRAQRMVDSSIWEFGAQGHLSYDPVPLDARGTTGSFLVHRRWLADAGRAESPDEFAKRVRNDYEISKRAIETHLRDHTVLACASRIGLEGIGGGRDAYQVNHDAMTSLFALGFVDDRFGVNDRSSDPHRLKRLRVDPGWSADDLMQRLHAALNEVPMQPSSTFPAWVGGDGDARLEHNQLIMRGTPRADVWLPGSQWAQEWAIEAEIWTDGAEIWIVQESATPGEEWRFGGHGRTLYLQRRQWGAVVETLAMFPLGIEPNTWHRVKLIKRGVGVWVEWDGRPLADRPAYLPGTWRGNVGWVAWRTDGPAQLHLKNLVFRRYPFELRPVSKEPSREEIQTLISEAATIAALSPLGAIVKGDGIQDVQYERELFTILSRRYGWEVIPRIRIEELGDDVPAQASASWPARLLERVEREQWAGIHVDTTRLSPSTRQTLDPAIQEMERRLREKSRRLIVSATGTAVVPPSGTYAAR